METRGWITIVSVLSLGILACGDIPPEPKEAASLQDLIQEIKLEEKSLVVSFKEDSNISYVTCEGGLFGHLDTDGQLVEIGAAQPDFCMNEEGYYLNDVFKTPHTCLGCDALVCQKLSGQSLSVSLVDYSNKGRIAPPVSYEYPHSFQRPDTVLNLESKTLTKGEIALELIYTNGDECSGKEHESLTMAIALDELQ